METFQTDESSRWNWPSFLLWAAVAFLALHRFINLGYGDLKDYDECLYAWRAKIVYFQGAWLDQSDLAWDHFLSAAFPPLQIWVTTIMFHLFGFSEFCARFWSALTGAGTVVVLFLMGRRLGHDRATGFFAALFIASIWYFTVFSRRGQFDVPFTFFVAVSIYGYVLYLDRVRIAGRRRIGLERGAWRWLVLSGLALGLGLMNKIAVAMMAPVVVGMVAVYAWVRGRHSFRRIIVEQAIINGVAFLVILPWHLAMTLSDKGEEFWQWYIGHHLLRRASTTIDLDAGPWYYYLLEIWRHLPPPILALILIALPCSAIAIVTSFRKREQDRTDDDAHTENPSGTEPSTSNIPHAASVADDHPWDHRDLCYALPLVWLGFPLLLFSVSGTKRPPYAIPLYPPIALLTAVFLGERLRDKRRMGLLAATLFFVFTVCLISRMKSLRRLLQSALDNLGHFGMFWDVWARLALIVLAVAAAVMFLRHALRRRPDTFRHVALVVLVGVVTVFCLRETRGVFDLDKGTRSIGWHEIRQVLDRMDYDYLVFAGHYYDPEKWYYFNGLHLNWHPTIGYIPMPKYDPAQLAKFAPDDDVRVVTRWSYLMAHWTEAERKDLLSKLQLQKHSGKDFAIYKLKTRP